MIRWLVLTMIPLAALAADPPFSHQKHAGVNLKCTFCHKGAETQERATFPKWNTCQTCHPDKSSETIPSRRVYKLADYVFFSHAKHTAAKMECAACHGDVKAQAVLQRHRPITMAACVDCHKQQNATTVCNACHELGQ
jgi:hypothetical protein